MSQVIPFENIPDITQYSPHNFRQELITMFPEVPTSLQKFYNGNKNVYQRNFTKMMLGIRQRQAISQTMKISIYYC